LDDEMLMRLSKGLGPLDEEEDTEQVAAFEEDDEDAPCSTSNFQVNMVIPQPVSGLDEPEMELIPITA